MLKSVIQTYKLSDTVLNLMHKFTDGINLCINVALEKNLSSRNALSKNAYPLLTEYKIPSYYYPSMISKALALVKTYRKRLRKGKKASIPHVNKLMLSTYYGFKIENGKIMIPISDERYKRGEYEEITLNNYVLTLTHRFLRNMSSSIFISDTSSLAFLGISLMISPFSILYIFIRESIKSTSLTLYFPSIMFSTWKCR